MMEVPRMTLPTSQADSPTQIVLRCGTFLLACTLFAMSRGRTLPQEVADLCRLSALVGFACYFVLELVADQRARMERHKAWQASLQTDLADQQFAKRLRAELAMANLRNRERDSLD
jgi:hypothetical protein